MVLKFERSSLGFLVLYAKISISMGFFPFVFVTYFTTKLRYYFHNWQTPLVSDPSFYWFVYSLECMTRRWFVLFCFESERVRFDCRRRTHEGWRLLLRRARCFQWVLSSGLEKLAFAVSKRRLTLAGQEKAGDAYRGDLLVLKHILNINNND